MLSRIFEGKARVGLKPEVRTVHRSGVSSPVRSIPFVFGRKYFSSPPQEGLQIVDGTVYGGGITTRVEKTRSFYLQGLLSPLVVLKRGGKTPIQGSVLLHERSTRFSSKSPCSPLRLKLNIDCTVSKRVFPFAERNTLLDLVFKSKRKADYSLENLPSPREALSLRLEFMLGTNCPIAHDFAERGTPYRAGVCGHDGGKYQVQKGFSFRGEELSCSFST